MSADNGIYVLVTRAKDPDKSDYEYRVLERGTSGLMDMVYFDPYPVEPESGWVPQEVWTQFQRAPVFFSAYVAFEYAKYLDKRTYTEHGISELFYGHVEFPDAFTKGELRLYDLFIDDHIQKEREKVAPRPLYEFLP